MTFSGLTLDGIGLILVGGAGFLLAGTTAFFLFRRAPDERERERLRRQTLAATGRLSTGQIDDVRGRTVYYSYEIGGVGYSAAQDLAALGFAEESWLADVSGTVGIRYERGQPENSIVHSETWSGLPRPASKQNRPGTAD